MNKAIGYLAIASALSLSACGDEKPSEKLCEQGDEHCEVGDGKCVVGYDGDCWAGQVCFAGEGAPKGKPGVCTDGQFGANGQLVAVALVEGFKQDEQWVWSPHPDNGECFSVFGGCPRVPLDPPPPPWLNKKPATLNVRVHGPHADTEQLKIAVRGVEHEGCVQTGITSEGRAAWQCNFPEENWAGENTTEILELKLWTENTPEFPRSSHFYVDTRAFHLRLEVLYLCISHVDGGGACFPEVLAHKVDVDEVSTKVGLEKVEYSSLEVLGDEGEVLWSSAEPMSCSADGGFSCSLLLPPDAPDGTIRATGVKATDVAGNEVSYDELTATRAF